MGKVSKYELLAFCFTLKTKTKFKSVYNDFTEFRIFSKQSLKQTILSKERSTLTEAILENNYFHCSTDNYVNISGTAMGT